MFVILVPKIPTRNTKSSSFYYQKITMKSISYSSPFLPRLMTNHQRSSTSHQQRATIIVAPSFRPQTVPRFITSKSKKIPHIPEFFPHRPVQSSPNRAATTIRARQRKSRHFKPPICAKNPETGRFLTNQPPTALRFFRRPPSPKNTPLLQIPKSPANSRIFFIPVP
jgi:hypothetical protein